MALSNAEKQRLHREKLKQQGLVHVQGWVTPAQAEAIKAIMAGEAVTYNPRSEKLPQKPTEGSEQGTATVRPPEVSQRPAEVEKPAPPSAAEKASPPKAAAATAVKPTLKKGERSGEWRVLADGEEIGTVFRKYRPKSGIAPAYNPWRIHRKGSAFDALSDRTYKTRAKAVQALVWELE